LNEVGGEISFLPQLRIECISRGRIRSDAVHVRTVVPTELGGTIRTVEELLSGCVEIVAALIGNDEFDRCSSTHPIFQIATVRYLYILELDACHHARFASVFVGFLSDLLTTFVP